MNRNHSREKNESINSNSGDADNIEHRRRVHYCGIVVYWTGYHGLVHCLGDSEGNIRNAMDLNPIVMKSLISEYPYHTSQALLGDTSYGTSSTRYGLYDQDKRKGYNKFRDDGDNNLDDDEDNGIEEYGYSGSSSSSSSHGYDPRRNMKKTGKRRREGSRDTVDMKIYDEDENQGSTIGMMNDRMIENAMKNIYPIHIINVHPDSRDKIEVHIGVSFDINSSGDDFQGSKRKLVYNVRVVDITKDSRGQAYVDKLMKEAFSYAALVKRNNSMCSSSSTMTSTAHTSSSNLITGAISSSLNCVYFFNFPGFLKGYQIEQLFASIGKIIPNSFSVNKVKLKLVESWFGRISYEKEEDVPKAIHALNNIRFGTKFITIVKRSEEIEKELDENDDSGEEIDSLEDERNSLNKNIEKDTGDGNSEDSDADYFFNNYLIRNNFC